MNWFYKLVIPFQQFLRQSMESFIMLVLTFIVVFRNGRSIFKKLGDSDVLFCLVFSISFAFAVGVSTFNFGTLVRYKIPLMPFFSLALLFLNELSKRDRKLAPLD